MSKTIRMNLQMFAEGDPTPEPTPAPSPQGKTFSEDYVKTIREEAKENRIARKAAEAEVLSTKAKFKALIGLKDDEDIDDVKISAYQASQQKALETALTKANARLITAEIKSLEGYDPKLVERLIDKSKIVIDDEGKITGLKEAVTALETEFPAIKVGGKQSGANPPASGNKEDLDMIALRKSMGLPIK